MWFLNKTVFQSNGLEHVEKVKVMEDIKKKDDHMRVLLAENQLLKQQAQEQEEQVAELKQELEGNDYLHAFVVPLGSKIV